MGKLNINQGVYYQCYYYDYLCRHLAKGGFLALFRKKGPDPYSAWMKYVLLLLLLRGLNTRYVIHSK